MQVLTEYVTSVRLLLSSGQTTKQQDLLGVGQRGFGRGGSAEDDPRESARTEVSTSEVSRSKPGAVPPL